MYDQLSIFEVLGTEAIDEKVEKIQVALHRMQCEEIPFNQAIWNACEQYLRDCRIFAMRKAEARGYTNAPTSAFPFP